MKRMAVASRGLWATGADMPDARAGNNEGSSDGPCITDVVIRRIRDAVRIPGLKRKPKPSTGRTATR